MLAALIIVLREVIEAGLVVGIVLAATQGVRGRALWVGLGIGGGLAGACMVALFAEAIADAINGAGQELFNAAILATAVAMLAWHNIWMSTHGRTMAAEVKTLGRAVAEGQRTLTALAVVVGVAVLREGSEVVLFLYGIAVTGQENAASMALGGVLGLLLGAGVAALMYLGLLRIPARHLFSATSTLITLLAAGMASQAVAFLQQGGLTDAPALAHLAQPVWNSAALLSDASWGGRILHVLVGYTDQPSALQLAAYLLTIGLIASGMKVIGKTAPDSTPQTVEL